MRAPRSPQLLLSCEHAGNRVPQALARLFAGNERMLRSHRGYDPGALDAAQALAQQTGAPLLTHMVSRLVIDLNRSLSHPRLFGPLTAQLDGPQRTALMRQLWLPHRRRVFTLLERADGPVDHLCLHSFTPVLAGATRSTDVGLLYDPKRPRERALAKALAASLRHRLPELTVRMNDPYKGTDDGLTTAMRQLFPDARYAGLEVEINQKWVRQRRWPALCQQLAAAIAAACAQPAPTEQVVAAAVSKRATSRQQTKNL